MKATLFGPQQNYSSFKNPILVIDRLGLIGQALALKISKEYLVVFVSQANWGKDVKNISKIPEGKYSHIIFIDEVDRDLDLLSTVIKKAKDVNAEFVFAQGLSAKREYAFNKVLHLYHSAKIVLFGDFFDNKLILERNNNQSIINTYLYQAQKFGRIQIQGDGLREIYPVFIGDIVDGLADILLGNYKAHSLFYIFPTYPSSELSLAHMIQKVNPEITVDFIKGDSRIKSMLVPPGGFNLLGEKYPLAKKIRDIDIHKKIDAERQAPYGRTNKFGRTTSFIVWTLIMLLFLPFIFTNFFSMLGKSMFSYARKEMDEENFVNVQSSLHLSQIFFNLEEQAANTLILQTKIIKKESLFKNLLEDANTNYKLSKSLSNIFDSGEYLSKILEGKSKDPNEDLTKSINALKTSLIDLEELRVEEKIHKPILQKIETAIPMTENITISVSTLSGSLEMKNEKTKTQLMIIFKLRNQIWEIIKLII